MVNLSDLLFKANIDFVGEDDRVVSRLPVSDLMELKNVNVQFSTIPDQPDRVMGKITGKGGNLLAEVSFNRKQSAVFARVLDAYEETNANTLYDANATL